MYPYQTETQYAIRGMLEVGQPFDVDDIKILTETILEDNGKYYDPIKPQDLKIFLLTLFEKGHIPGYYLVPKYVCDETGPKVTLEFAPENGLATLDLINKPTSNGKPVHCTIHKEYKQLLEFICKKADCSQDMMVRSILIKALDSINDQLK